jgi:hypothetical protein
VHNEIPTEGRSFGGHPLRNDVGVRTAC